jgi:site-specific recombinase XerD
MSPHQPCGRCGAPVKFRDRSLCHACTRRAARQALKSPCPRCGRVRHLRSAGTCAICDRPAGPRPAKTVACRQCGEQRPNAGHGLCNRCKLADPDWPFRYGASLAARLPDIPGWWQELTEFAAARHHPGGAVAILRCAGRVLLDDSSAGPRQITDSLTRPDGTPAAEGKALTAFFAGSGLIMPGDQAGRRATARRQRFLDAVPEGLAAAVTAFNDAQLAERERDRRAGRRLLSDVTLETRLRILRDLARHLPASGRITSWTEVTTADLEGFLAGRARNRHQETYVLRRYFAWARQRKLILIDPARPLRLGPQPGFTGTVLDAGTQRTLLSRWTSDATHPHERLAGLLALLHAASSAEIRSLAVTAADDRKRTIMLPGRPFPVPADPATWDAVQACLRHRDQLATLNPHLIVTKATRTGTASADGSYLTRLLAPAGVTPSACRQTRIAQFVNDLDPKLTASALGMQDSGLVRYLADNVDKDRLQRLSPR